MMADDQKNRWVAQVVRTNSSGTQTFYLNYDQVLCKKCLGTGHWDSCFDCGNKGYYDLEKEIGIE